MSLQNRVSRSPSTPPPLRPLPPSLPSSSSSSLTRLHFLPSRGRSPFRTPSRVYASSSSFSFLLPTRFSHLAAPSLYFNRLLEPTSPTPTHRDRRATPSPSPTNLRPLRSNVYVSPASIILTQPPINRIQARRIAEYRWDTYVRQAGRQTGLGLGSGSSSVYVHLRNTAW